MRGLGDNMEVKLGGRQDQITDDYLAWKGGKISFLC